MCYVASVLENGLAEMFFFSLACQSFRTEQNISLKTLNAFFLKFYIGCSPGSFTESRSKENAVYVCISRQMKNLLAVKHA